MMHSPVPEKWRVHTWAKADKIAYAHVDFLLPLSNPNWKNQTDLPDGTMVDLKTLWSHMCEHGMFDPLVVRLGMTDHTIRLETGNQRIRLFADHGVEYVPIVCEVAVDSIGNPQNGTHVYPWTGDQLDMNVGYYNPFNILPHHVLRRIDVKS